MYFNLRTVSRCGESYGEWSLRASLATCRGTSTDPSSVQQPCIGIVMLDLIRQHLRIAHWVESQERLSKARGERCLRLSNTVFGTRHLRRIARYEMKHRLLGVEFRDWWENSSCIAGQEDNVGWMIVRNTGDLGILDIFNGVRTAHY